jgi:hypothetical protein
MSNTPPTGRDGPQSMRRKRAACLLAGAFVSVAIVVMVVLLASFMSSTALRILDTFSASAPTHALVGHSTPSQTAPQVGSPTATPQSNGDWSPYVNLEYGFRLGLPGVLASSHGFFINNFAGQGFDMAYLNAPITTPLQRLEAETAVEVLYSTAITDRDICPDAGAPVMLGAGIGGRQQTNVPPAANGPAALYPYVHVSLVLNGVAIRVELRGQGPSETFLARYAALWQHMLASFAPVAGGPVYTTHPCG